MSVRPETARRRQAVLSGAEAGGGSKEGVFKSISWLKSASAVRRAVEYVGRLRAEDEGVDRPLLWHDGDRTGRAFLDGTLAAMEAIGEWELLADADNLSRKAREADELARSLMPAEDRLHFRQALHGVFSAVLSGPADRRRFEAAVEAAIGEAFVSRGHRVIWAVHEDHPGRVHVHMIVAARQDPASPAVAGKPRRLRSERSTPDELRRLFVEHARRQGLDMTATAREDRSSVRAGIADGSIPLRPPALSPFGARNADMLKRLMLAAPRWSVEHLADYERRRADAARLRWERGEAARMAWRPGFRTWVEAADAVGREGFALALDRRRRPVLVDREGGTVPLRSLARDATLAGLENRFGASFEEFDAGRSKPSGWSRLFGSPRPRPSPAPAPGEAVTATSFRPDPAMGREEARRALAEDFGRRFADPDRALERFRLLRAEILADDGQGLSAAEGERRRRPERYADWLAARLPEMFGPLRPGAPAPALPVLERLLKAADLGRGEEPLPEPDMDMVRRSRRTIGDMRRLADSPSRAAAWRRDVGRMVSGLASVARTLEETVGTSTGAGAVREIARDTLRRANEAWSRRSEDSVVRSARAEPPAVPAVRESGRDDGKAR